MQRRRPHFTREERISIGISNHQFDVLGRVRCPWCGKTHSVDQTEVDHRVALAMGGSNERSNLRLLGARCNAQKGAGPPERQRLSFQTLRWSHHWKR
jgi:5-methylcytosine-specific restriction endonuclease McrA